MRVDFPEPFAPMMPSIWYQMGLHCREVSKACPFDGVEETACPCHLLSYRLRPDDLVRTCSVTHA